MTTGSSPIAADNSPMPVPYTGSLGFLYPEPVPPRLPSTSSPFDSVFRRTSPRFMKSAVSSHSHSSDKKTSNKPPRNSVQSFRGQMRGPIQVDLENLLPYWVDVLNGCATLAIQNHCIRKLQNWRHWRIIKIVKASKIRVSGLIYYLTFQAEKVDENGHRVQQTFEAHVWDAPSHRRVNGFRTIKPPSNWYPGTLWIPLTRPPPQAHELVAHPRSPAVLERLRTMVTAPPWRRSSRLKDYNQLVPPRTYGGDSRAAYNEQANKLAKKSSENNNQSEDISKRSAEEDILTLGTEPVKLHLGKLSDSDFHVLEDCATLAMQDHLIQTCNIEWRDWRFLKIEKALKICPDDGGCDYFITFQAEKGNDRRTLDAEVWDGISQRRVKRFRTLQPRITEWYPGKLWIPI